MDISFDLVVKDATRVEADVLALKYAQANYGLDRIVSDTLIEKGTNPSFLRPKPGAFRIYSALVDAGSTGCASRPPQAASGS